MKKIIIFLIYISFLPLLYGCWGKVDVDEMVTASAIGIDKTESGYKVTIQAMNASSLVKEGSNRANIIVYSEEGKSVFEALRRLTSYFPSKIFMAHYQLMVFGEDMAKDGIKDSILFLYTDPETRQRYNIAVVKGGTAEDLLKILTPVNKNPASEINAAIDSYSKNYGGANVVYIDEVLSCIITKQSNPILTGIEIEGDPKKGAENKNLEQTDLKTKIKINGLAVFKDDKLVGWFNADESIGFNHILGNITSTIITTFVNDYLVTFEVRKTKVKTYFKLSEKPKITVDYTIIGNISEINPGKSNFTTKEIKDIEHAISKSVREQMDTSVKKTQQEYQTDIFRFGNLIYRKKPQYWKKIEPNYDEIYKDLDIEIKVKTKVSITRL